MWYNQARRREAIVERCSVNQIRGDRVRELRERAGLTQGQLAYKADTTSSQISRLENNERPGAQAILVGRIAAILGTTVDYLLGNTDNPYPPFEPSRDDNGVDPELQDTANRLIEMWEILKKLDPPSAERLRDIAVFQAEMVLAAARAGQPEPTEQPEDNEAAS